MSDESFFREINQELRQDRARDIWDRYGLTALAVGVAIVLATAAWAGWDWWTTRQANESGDRFSQALTLATEGRSDEALAALSELEADGHGAYPVLARMRAATVQADAGDFTGAVAAFDAVAADTGVPQSIRDVARLRSAYLLVDHGSYEDVAARVEALTSDDNALRLSAREALALAAWRDGQGAEALRLFDLIVNDQNASAAMRQRAGMMGELIRGAGEPA